MLTDGCFMQMQLLLHNKHITTLPDSTMEVSVGSRPTTHCQPTSEVQKLPPASNTTPADARDTTRRRSTERGASRRIKSHKAAVFTMATWSPAPTSSTWLGLEQPSTDVNTTQLRQRHAAPERSISNDSRSDIKSNTAKVKALFVFIAVQSVLSLTHKASWVTLRYVTLLARARTV